MSATKKSSEALRRELLDLEHAFWNAMKVRDAKTCERLTDKTTIVVGPSGIGELDKAAMADMIEHARWKLERFDLHPDKLVVKFVDEDVAIIAYEIDERVVVEGRPESIDTAPLAIRAYDTSVWVRRLGKWVCAMHTETLAGDPFGRDRTPPEHRA